MHLFSLSTPAMAVALIFAIWQRYFRFCLRREQVLRHRIAYLLWMVAEHTTE